MSRCEYRLDLSARSEARRCLPASVRPPTEADFEGLAKLMLDAYIGTIDDEGESIGEARAEVRSWLAASPLLGWPRVATEDGLLVAAVLVSRFGEQPLIAYAMTRSSHKSKGLATAVLQEVLARLSAAGENEVGAFITEGNTPSEIVFTRAGFIPIAAR